MAGKYTPIENYLRDLPKGQREVTLRLEQIEEILNSKLLEIPGSKRDINLLVLRIKK